MPDAYYNSTSRHSWIKRYPTMATIFEVFSEAAARIYHEAGVDQFQKTKVLVNPSLAQLKKLASSKVDTGSLGSLRGVLNKNDAYFWDNDDLLHRYFLDNKPLSGVKITIEIMPLESPVEINASVTNRELSKFFSLPEDKQIVAIKEHPWVQKNCGNCKISV